MVPVGDAFDALAESEDPIDDPVMKARFDRARDLYRESVLPIIRRQHNTDSPSARQRLREDHDRRLGCSGCKQTMCRNDNRLAKTLLMAALVPEAKPFKGLTVKRLAHLESRNNRIADPRRRDAGGREAAARLGKSDRCASPGEQVDPR